MSERKEEVKKAIERMDHYQKVFFNKVIGSTPTKQLIQPTIEVLPTPEDIEEAQKGPKMIQLRLKSGDSMPLWTQNLRPVQMKLEDDGTIVLWYLRDFLNRVV